MTNRPLRRPKRLDHRSNGNEKLQETKHSRTKHSCGWLAWRLAKQTTEKLNRLSRSLALPHSKLQYEKRSGWRGRAGPSRPRELTFILRGAGPALRAGAQTETIRPAPWPRAHTVHPDEDIDASPVSGGPERRGLMTLFLMGRVPYMAYLY